MKFSMTWLSGLVLSLICSVTIADPGAAFGVYANGTGSQYQAHHGLQQSTQQSAGVQMGTQGFGSQNQQIRNHQQGMQQFGSPAGQLRMHRAFDENGDGMITIDEFLMRALTNIDNMFDRHDTDSDGLLTEAEYADMHRYPIADDIDQEAFIACVNDGVGAGSMYLLNNQMLFADLDANGDGFIDTDEFETARIAFLTDRFSTMDLNADAVITPLELSGALGTMRERRNIHRQCIEEQQDFNELIDS